MIEIKDVIHLYLGAECIVPENYNYRGILTRIDIKFHGDSGACQLNSDTWYSVKMVKPIFRPLSDITEEEKEVCYNLDTNHPVNDSLLIYNIGVAAETTRYLLSLHFDIFNLHEQGLCLYKSDLK